MLSDAIIKQTGLEALKEKLGTVEMERFVVLMNRENFDYTKWRRSLFEDMDIEELADKAEKYSKRGEG